MQVSASTLCHRTGHRRCVIIIGRHSCHRHHHHHHHHHHDGLAASQQACRVFDRPHTTPICRCVGCLTLNVSPFGPERVRLISWSVAILELGYVILQPSHLTSEVDNKAISSTCMSILHSWAGDSTAEQWRQQAIAVHDMTGYRVTPITEMNM